MHLLYPLFFLVAVLACSSAGYWLSENLIRRTHSILVHQLLLMVWPVGLLVAFSVVNPEGIPSAWILPYIALLAVHGGALPRKGSDHAGHWENRGRRAAPGGPGSSGAQPHSDHSLPGAAGRGPYPS